MLIALSMCVIGASIEFDYLTKLKETSLVWKKWDGELIIWLVALESMIQKVEWGGENALRKIPAK